MSDLTLVLCFASMLFIPCGVASITLLRPESHGEGVLSPATEGTGHGNAPARDLAADLTREQLAARRYRELYRRGLL